MGIFFCRAKSSYQNMIFPLVAQLWITTFLVILANLCKFDKQNGSPDACSILGVGDPLWQTGVCVCLLYSVKAWNIRFGPWYHFRQRFSISIRPHDFHKGREVRQSGTRKRPEVWIQAAMGSWRWQSSRWCLKTKACDDGPSLTTTCVLELRYWHNN